jgi:hypothetical protein
MIFWRIIYPEYNLQIVNYFEDQKYNAFGTTLRKIFLLLVKTHHRSLKKGLNELNILNHKEPDTNMSTNFLRLQKY